MASSSHSGEGITPCPICGNATLLESCEPSGVAFCPSCGYLWHGFRAGLKANGLTKAEGAKILGLLIRKLEIKDSIDFLDLAFRLKRLEKQGITLEDLKEEDIQAIQELLRCDEDDVKDLEVQQEN